MPLRLVAWIAWQRPFIYETQRKRVDKSAPVVMKYIAFATRLDDEPRAGEAEGNWSRFKRLVGARVAETWLIRTLQYVGEKSALDGVVRLDRDSFCLALSRDGDVVKPAEGAKVYDALILSGIAEEWAPGVTAGVPPGQLPGNLPGKVAGEIPGQLAGQLPGNLPAFPAGPAPARSRAPARLPAPDRARSEAVAVAVAGGSPQPPSPEGGGSASPLNGSGNGHAPKATVSDRAAMDAILTKQAAFFGPASAQSDASRRAQVLRAQLRRGEVTDGEIAAFLAKNETSFRETCVAARAEVRREARESRRGRAPTLTDRDDGDEP